MTWVALKSLSERRTRAALTALAIVLGVAMIAGSLILTDTIDRAFTNIFSSSYTKTDLVVRGTPVVADSFAGAPTVPADAAPADPGASPGVADGRRHPDRPLGHGQHRQDGRPRRQGHQGNMPDLRLRRRPRAAALQPADPGRRALGRRARTRSSSTSSTAADHGFAVGDTIGVAAEGPVRTFTITGLAALRRRGLARRRHHRRLRHPDRPQVLDKTGFDAIQVAAAPGVSEDELAARDRAAAARDGARSRPATEQAAADKEVISEAITFIRGFLLAFGGIALFVGAFVIFNTLSITVAQRSRELATLRTLGASRRQVLRSVIAEAGDHRPRRVARRPGRSASASPRA